MASDLPDIKEKGQVTFPSIILKQIMHVLLVINKELIYISGTQNYEVPQI